MRISKKYVEFFEQNYVIFKNIYQQLITVNTLKKFKVMNHESCNHIRMLFFDQKILVCFLHCFG